MTHDNLVTIGSGDVLSTPSYYLKQCLIDNWIFKNKLKQDTDSFKETHFELSEKYQPFKNGSIEFFGMTNKNKYLK